MRGVHPTITRDLAAGDKPGKFTADVITYDALDDYDTEFAPGVFDESMIERMPRIVWGHDWRLVLGRWTEGYDVDVDGLRKLRLHGELDDFDAVPMARQAWAQMESGTIDQFSVGFIPLEWVDRDDKETRRKVRRFTRGRLDEVSLVLLGAVPETALVDMRERRVIPLIVREPLVPKEAAAAIMLRLHLGEIDLADALTELKAVPNSSETDETSDTNPDEAAGADETLTDETGNVDPAEVGAEATSDEPEPDDELLAEADEALSLVEAHV